MLAKENMLPSAGNAIETREAAREFAIDWQQWQSTQSMSWGKVAEWQTCFEALAEKFDLLEEYKENGIL